ncbi:hypothetical protein HanRHA438_Chr13g0626081 [Helianthus annuus]|nr:hypothetical protein HanRHA438_Chr13g0626081 [Helianthus annuus]
MVWYKMDTLGYPLRVSMIGPNKNSRTSLPLFASMITSIPRTIILLIPSNKLLQPHLKIRRWFIAKLPFCQTNIRMSKRDITVSLSLL